MAYTALAPSKRVRAVLDAAVRRAVRRHGRPRGRRPPRAIELVHASSLILDDLPAMDDAPLRRGRPANHLAFGEAIAILAAFGLLNLAYGVLAARLRAAARERRCRRSSPTRSDRRADRRAGRGPAGDRHGDQLRDARAHPPRQDRRAVRRGGRRRRADGRRRRPTRSRALDGVREEPRPRVPDRRRPARRRGQPGRNRQGRPRRREEDDVRVVQRRRRRAAARRRAVPDRGPRAGAVRARADRLRELSAFVAATEPGSTCRADTPPEHDTRVDDLRQQLRALGYLDAGVDRFVLGAGARRARPVGHRAAREPAHRPARRRCCSGRPRRSGSARGCPGSSPASATRSSIAHLPGRALRPRRRRRCVRGQLLVSAARAAHADGAAHAADGAVAGGRRARHDRVPRVPDAAGGATVRRRARGWSRAGVDGRSRSSWRSRSACCSATRSRSPRSRSSLRATGTRRCARRRAGTSWRVAARRGATRLRRRAPALQRRRDGPRRHRTSRRLTVVPSGSRVRLIAIDGFDPALFEELPRPDGCPGSPPRSAAAAPARVATRRTGEPARLDPARAWTTIATGAAAATVHGVETLETRRVAGLQGTPAGRRRSASGRPSRAATDLLRLTRPSIASGTERREKTFWEVAADAGLRTSVVNWWATWPRARPDTAIVLSDRATLRLEQGGALDAEIAPAALYEPLRGSGRELRARAQRGSASALDGTSAAAMSRRCCGDRRSSTPSPSRCSARGVATAPRDLDGRLSARPRHRAARAARLPTPARRRQRPRCRRGSTRSSGYYACLDALLRRPLAPASARS